MTPAHPTDSLTSLSDAELFANVQRLTARSNATLAALLAHLGEVEARGIHRLRACASLYAYCIYELRMSEDAAYRRSKAARFVREYPELRDAIAKGEIHLTGLLVIGPHLGGERHTEILRRARFRTKREICRLVAELDPRPDVPALVSPIGPELPGPATHRTFVEALSGPYRVLPFGQRPEDWMGDGVDCEGVDDGASDDVPVGDGRGARDAAATRAGAVTSNDPATGASAETPEAQRALRYRVQFTANQEFVDLLQEVTDLLGHENPRPSLPEVQLRALRMLVKELRAKKRAATSRPRPARAPHQDATIAPTEDGHVVDAAPERGSAPEHPDVDAAPERSNNRHIPAAVQRTVWGRDTARCAYVDDRGMRCRETCGLEVHHLQAHALGGLPTPVNLELRCRAHNTLAAEQDFGREHMDRMRGAADRATRTGMR